MNPERWLAAAVLAATILTAAVESRSALSTAIREGRPWVFEMELGGEDPGRFAAIYEPYVPALELVALPETRYRSFKDQEARENALLKEIAGRAPSSGTPARLVWNAPGWPALHPLRPVAGALWARQRSRRSYFWRALLLGRGLPSVRRDLSPGSRPSAWDSFLLGLELGRVQPDLIQGAFLPPADLREGFIARSLRPAFWRPVHGRPIACEVLNSSGRAGLAAEATKILRSGGVDVVNYGNFKAAFPGTVIYDRKGRIGNALRVSRVLGGDAQIVSEIPPNPWLDVSVVLGGMK